MELPKHPREVPDIQEAVPGGVAPGSAYVVDELNNELKPLFDQGGEAVLASSGDSRELLVTTQYNVGEVSSPGTYLAPDDYATLSSQANPTMRRYGFWDSFRKFRSWRGIAVWAPLVLGLLLAVLGVLAFTSDATTTTSETVADRAQTAMEWMVRPLESLPPDADQAAFASARQSVQSRRTAVARCMRLLRGAEAAEVTIPDVKCERETATGLANEDTRAAIAAIIGLLVAALGTIGVRGKFGFQQQPA